MQPFRTLISRTVVMPQSNIDTDQIIPARFLKGTERSGLGRFLFANVRYDAEGKPRSDFILNRPEVKNASILVAGDNFGCGSSREHAVWALSDFGFRAVVSSSIADIFRVNALKNGMVPVVIRPAAHQKLLDAPGRAVAIDLETLTLTLPDQTAEPFALDAFARRCLLDGVDELGFLLAQAKAIGHYEDGRKREGSFS